MKTKKQLFENKVRQIVKEQLLREGPQTEKLLNMLKNKFKQSSDFGRGQMAIIDAGKFTDEHLKAAIDYHSRFSKQLELFMGFGDK